MALARARLYATRPDVGAVIHTHSPHATAWSFAAMPLDYLRDELRYFDTARFAVVRYAPSGSERLAHAAAQGLRSGAAVLLERHGVVAVGPDLRSVLERCVVVEH